MLNQLRIKFVAITMSISAVLMCVIMVMLYSFTAAALNTDVTTKMQSIGDGLSRGGFHLEHGPSEERLHYFVISPTPRGELMAIGTKAFDLTDTEALSALYKIAMESEEGTGILTEDALKYMRIPAIRDTVLFADISDELNSLETLRSNCILVGILSMVATAIISQLLANWMIRPVETAWEQQKQFVADASHELKTPLTVIMTNTEMLASPDYTAREKSRFVESTAEMTKRMRYLVEDMLDLARVDSGVVRTGFQRLDYSLLNEQCILPFEPMYFESGRMLEADIDADIHLTGSESHLKQVTDILLDNALKYSHPDTTTLLSLHREGKHALLCADSIGDPISAEDLQNIFRRFYTVDKARTGSSYGLGLSIAQSIVNEHKGRIWAESSNGHNRFYVKLPL